MLIRPPKADSPEQLMPWFDKVVQAVNDKSVAAASTIATTTATGPANAAYGTPERDMLNALIADVGTLKDCINDLRSKLIAAGLMA